MPLPRLELSGRDWQLRNLVQEFVAWPARTAPPVLILLGPPGSGKTTFLGLLRSRLADVPHAHADLGTAEGAADFPLLSQLGGLAFQLRAHFGTQPTLDLSAFRTALLVATAQADGFDRTRAYRDIRAAVRGPGREPGAADAAIQQLLEQAASIANAQLGQLVGQLVPVSRSLWDSVKVRRSGAVLGRSRQGADHRSPQEFMVELNRQYRGNSAERAAAEGILAETLLWDVAHAYHRARNRRDRTIGSVLLLDNVDSDAGRQLLRLLTTARTRLATGEGPGTAPLLVVATARPGWGELPDGRATRAVGESEDVHEVAASAADWDAMSHRRHGPGGSYYPVLLRDLTLEETIARAELWLSETPQAPPPYRNPDRWLGWYVHRVTGGHPAAVDALLETAVGDAPELPWVDRIRRRFDLPAVDARRQPDFAVPLRAVLERALSDVPEPLREHLPRLAAAADLDRAESVEALWESDEGLLMAYARLDKHRLPRTSWHQLSGSESVLHPMVRYLLLRRLDQQPGAWDRAHSQLRDAFRTVQDGVADADPRHDHVDEQYHALALGEVGDVTRSLADRFRAVGASAWCAEYDRISVAPNRLRAQHPGARVRQLFDQLVREAAPQGALASAVARLLVAGWLQADPLGDPDAELTGDIEQAWLDLSRLTDQDQDRNPLRARAARFKEKPWL